MKNVVRLTEADLRNMISEAVKRMTSEAVLGDNWHENDNTDVLNNYEPFEDQENHDFSISGEHGIDPTVYGDDVIEYDGD